MVAIGLFVVPQLRDVETYNGTLCQKIEEVIAVTQSEIQGTLPGTPRSELEGAMTILSDQLQQAKDAGCEVSTDSESSVSSASEPVSSSPEAPATTASPAPEPAQDSSSAVVVPAPAADDSWTPRWFVNENDPNSPRNFGPAVNPDTAVDEFKPRMEADPALLCANGLLIQTSDWNVASGEDGSSRYAECLDKVLGSKSARDAYVGEVFGQIAEMHVETRDPQQVDTAFMRMGPDGRVHVFQTSITRTVSYHVLVITTTDGRTITLRLECGFQWDTGVVIVTVEVTQPESSPSSVPSGSTPYTPAPPCVNGNGRDENGGCNVPPGNPGTDVTTTPGTPGTESTISTPSTTTPATSTPSTPSTTTGSTTSTTTSTTTTENSGKTGYNTAAVTTGSESHSVNNNDGATDSQGRQDDPAHDAEVAASSAAAAASSQSAAASSAAAEADTDSGGGSDSHGSVSVTATATAGPTTGAAGENTDGSVWGN
jgi:hypothetical protein